MPAKAIKEVKIPMFALPDEVAAIKVRLDKLEAKPKKEPKTTKVRVTRKPKDD